MYAGDRLLNDVKWYCKKTKSRGLPKQTGELFMQKQIVDVVFFLLSK